MPSLFRTALGGLFIFGASAQIAMAQAGAGNFDLTDYSAVSVHQDWTLLCTPPGTGTRTGDHRDCALEDAFGLVVFVFPSGYYGLTIRDHADGDQILGQTLADSPDSTVVTYYSPAFAAAHIGDEIVFQNGEDRRLSDAGFAEAEARALALMQGAAP